jgi:hypothetical protein
MVGGGGARGEGQRLGLAVEKMGGIGEEADGGG